jgi:hypothetical protein
MRCSMTTENEQNDVALSADKQAGLSVVAGDVLKKWDWIGKQLPTLVPNIGDYSSLQRLSEMLDCLSKEGRIDEFADALDGLRSCMAEIIAIMAMDVTGAQLARLAVKSDVVGNLGMEKSLALKALLDGVYKANKIALEIKAEAGFSKRARRELGDGIVTGFARLVKSVSEGDPVPEAEDMTGFFGARAMRSPEVVDGQFTLVEESPDLTDDEVRELLE